MYLFRSLEDLETYKAKHLPRLAKMGITDVRHHVFDIMEDLCKIKRAPLRDMRDVVCLFFFSDKAGELR